MITSSLQKNKVVNREEFDDAIEQTAISLATLLNDVEIRRLVKSEAAKEFDGDSEVLFSTISAKRLSDGKTFMQKLGRSRAEKKRRSGQPISDEVGASEMTQQIEKIPLFQIGVPYYIIEKWNAETQVPLVICLPGGADKGVKMGRVKAYKSDGSLTWIDAKEFIKNPYPVVVLGVNERTNPDGTVRKDIIPLDKKTNSMKGEHQISILPQDPTPVPQSTWTLVLSTLVLKFSAIDLWSNWDWLSQPDLRCDINWGSPSARRTDVNWVFWEAYSYFWYNNPWPIQLYMPPFRKPLNIPVFYSSNKIPINLDFVDQDYNQFFFFDQDDLVEHRWRHLGLSDLDIIDFPNGIAGSYPNDQTYFYEGQESRIDMYIYWIPPF